VISEEAPVHLVERGVEVNLLEQGRVELPGKAPSPEPAPLIVGGPGGAVTHRGKLLVLPQEARHDLSPLVHRFLLS
jgi:hypothetical protein